MLPCPCSRKPEPSPNAGQSTDHGLPVGYGEVGYGEVFGRIADCLSGNQSAICTKEVRSLRLQRRRTSDVYRSLLDCYHVKWNTELTFGLFIAFTRWSSGSALALNLGVLLSVENQMVPWNPWTYEWSLALIVAVSISMDTLQTMLLKSAHNNKAGKSSHCHPFDYGRHSALDELDGVLSGCLDFIARILWIYFNSESEHGRHRAYLPCLELLEGVGDWHDFWRRRQ